MKQSRIFGCGVAATLLPHSHIKVLHGIDNSIWSPAAWLRPERKVLLAVQDDVRSGRTASTWPWLRSLVVGNPPVKSRPPEASTRTESTGCIRQLDNCSMSSDMNIKTQQGDASRSSSGAPPQVCRSFLGQPAGSHKVSGILHCCIIQTLLCADAENKSKSKPALVLPAPPDHKQ
jgi:hypothetical protein